MDPYRENSRHFFEQTQPDISVDDLGSFFDNDGIRNGDSSRKLAHWGGIYSLARVLKIDFRSGLITTGNSVDLQKRALLYGSNYHSAQEPKSLWAFVEESLEDTMLRILIVAATVSMIVEMIEDYETGWMDGVAIFMSVVIIVSVSSINNYVKEKQFEKLYASQEKTNVNVFRNNRTETICVFDLVVGDLLFIQAGDIIPVDGILIKAANIRMDEASVTGESELVNKIPAQDIFLPDQNGQPFIISDSKVMDGTGLLLVCTVGANTQINKIRMRLGEEQPPTPLQVKLEEVANAIGKIGTGSALVTFLALLFHLIYNIAIGDIELWSMDALEDLIDYLLLAVTIIVVAVPEGLPLAVTLSLAYSVNKMKDENNFVRHLEACETMGGANNICSDKTGTLTQNIMTVTNFFIEDQEFYYRSFDPHSIDPMTFQNIVEGICINSEATPIRTEQGTMEHRGDRTECALIEFVDRLGYDYRDYRPSNKIVKIIPFSSERKKMSSVYHDLQTGKYILFCKGAPEFMFERCTSIVKPGRKVVPLTPYEKHDLNYKVIMKFAEQSLRTLALAYREFKEDPTALSDDELEKNLTLVGVMGMQDPLRPEVKEAVIKCMAAGITVRMVTGDNLVTACSIAKQCGILESNFDLSEIMNPNKKSTSYKVLEGAVFRELIGGIVYEKSETEKNEGKQGVGKVANFEKFKEIAKDLKVLARSSSRDKYMLVAGLIQMGNVVAVTGDGTNDVEALKKADIGFAMGITGKKVTKWAADIILLDDNFRSIVTACKWGRNIYDSIRKFIQFQLTVNVVALILAFLGSVVVTKSPLNAIQMLWVNLIMDSFASLALATEKPTDELLKRPPHGRNEFIISPNMWRNILCHSLFQITVLCVIMFYGPEIFGIASSFDMDTWNQDEGVHFTIVFHSFVFMQIFNEINCRKLRKNEFNVFEGICSNWVFITIELMTVGVQVLIVQYGGSFVECSTLTLEQHLICVGLGAMELIVSIFIKCLPECLFNRIKLLREPKHLYNMDDSFPSMLRHRASIRINKSNSRSMIWLKTI